MTVRNKKGLGEYRRAGTHFNKKEKFVNHIKHCLFFLVSCGKGNFRNKILNASVKVFNLNFFKLKCTKH